MQKCPGQEGSTKVLRPSRNPISSIRVKLTAKKVVARKVNYQMMMQLRDNHSQQHLVMKQRLGCAIYPSRGVMWSVHSTSNSLLV